MRKAVFLKALFTCLLMGGCGRTGERPNIIDKPNSTLIQGMNTKHQVSQSDAPSGEARWIASSEEVPNISTITINELPSDMSGLMNRNTLGRNITIQTVRPEKPIQHLSSKEAALRSLTVEENRKTELVIAQPKEERPIAISSNTKNPLQSSSNDSFEVSNKENRPHNHDIVLNAVQTEESDSEQNLVYGIDLRQYKNKLNQPEVDDGKKDETKSLSEQVHALIESMKEQSMGLTFLTVIVLLVVANFIAVRRTYRGQAVFFGSGGDVFLFCLPLLVVVLACIWLWSEKQSSTADAGHTSAQGVLIIGALIFLFLYNVARPLLENRHRSFVVILCIIVSRLTLGYLLVFAIILAAISTHTMRRPDESDLAFEKRRTNNMLRGTAALGGLGLILASLVRCPDWDVEDFESESELEYEGDEDYSCQFWEEPVDSCSEWSEPEPQSDYEVLGVPPTATKEEIKQAYREKAKHYHPDKTAHLAVEFQELAHKKMQRINDAYESLMNEKETV